MGKKVRDPSFQVTTVYEFQIDQFSLASILATTLCIIVYTPCDVYVNSDVRDMIPTREQDVSRFIHFDTYIPFSYLFLSIPHP